MALRLVNTAPGEVTDTVKPGQYAHLGLKSELLKVPLGSVAIEMGMSNFIHHGLLPENDTALQGIAAEVVLETSERRRPQAGETPRSVSSGALVFTKNTLAPNEFGIYEVKVPIAERAAILASFRFKTKTGWTPSSVDWCNLSNMTGMYFGLEHGTYNTACYAFLRANSPSGSLVVGGPLQAYNTARPGQLEVIPAFPHASTPGFAWRSLPNDSVVEVYIYFNTAGYETAPATGVPINAPLVEVWTKTPANPAPVVQAYLPMGSLGQFPSSLSNPAFTNSRPGVSETATIFFGNIAKTAGTDVLELLDWAIYPDYRIAVKEGTERPDHNFIVDPDAPVEYRAKDNKLLTELLPGRWFPETGGGWDPPVEELFFQPGRRGEALYTSIIKETSPSFMALHKTEPRFEERQDGIMVEAFISGEYFEKTGDGTGFGFSVEDGLVLYQVLAVESPTRRFFAICKDVSQLSVANQGYHQPATEVDFGSLKLVRLLIDRRRPASLGGGKAQLVVDEEVVLTTDLSTDVFPVASSPVGMIRIGHLGLFNATSKLNIAMLNYLPRYLAWEGVDLLLPDDVGIDSGVKFTQDIVGLGTGSMTGSELVIEKTSTGGSSALGYHKDQQFAEVDGTLVDFRVRVDTYSDFGGEAFASRSPAGTRLVVFLGNKKVEVGFFDCGVYGRMVGILPRSGDVNDIINQTDVGKVHSAPVDWSRMTSYRLTIKGYDRIELTIGSPVSPPSIVLNWVDNTSGFELPADVSTPRLAFGHYDHNTTSKSTWQYVRWGLSNGFETAIQQEYPNGYPKYLFGGRLLIKTEFDEA